jgi:lipoprotein-releasing system permease protein
MLPVVANDSLLRVIKQTSGVAHIQQYAAVAGMLKTDENFRGIQMKGLGEDYDTNFLQQNLLEGRLPKFSATQSANEVLVSKLIANELELKVGDRVYAYFLSFGEDSKAPMRARRLTVTGIYETHLSEYDRGLCFTDIRTVRRLNKWEKDECSGIELDIADGFDNAEVVAALSAKINGTVDRIGAHRGAFTIQEIAPHVFAWLDVLNVNVIMILILMMAIGGFTIVSGQLILMLERIRMIGVLKALGATHASIRHIFRNFALMLVGRGLIWGNVIGLGLCALQKYFSLVKLNANTYYIDSVPIEFNWPFIILLNIGVMLISAVVVFGSSYLISIDAPARTMRFE